MNRQFNKYSLLTLVLMLVALTGCMDEMDSERPLQEVTSHGTVGLSFSVSVPDMKEVVTRSVDEDATDVETIRLFCFDKNGLFITTATTTSHDQGAADSDGYYLSGTFTAEVPDYTHVVHLVANQNLDDFNESEWLGMSESEVMTTLTATSNRMIYWGRIEAEEGETMKDAMKRVSDADGGGIVLIRDQAKVTVRATADSGFTLSDAGYYVCNTNAFGTIAPYNRRTNAFDWRVSNPKYITLPKETERTTTPLDVANQTAQYVFETPNELSDPVNLIIKGANQGETEKYYRVLLLDNMTGEPIPLVRNHHYIVEVRDTLSYGYNTFAEALKGAATNNVWISIANEIQTVSDGNYSLSVKEPQVVILGPESFSVSYPLTYTYTDVDGKGVQGTDIPTVSWITDGNNVAQSALTHTYDSSTGEGRIQIRLLPMENNAKREGTLLIKKGKLQRYIQVVTVKKMDFTPAWVSTAIYSGAARQKVTLMFTVPENCPDGLLPMRVLISINHMDVRAASGMQLPVITKATNPDEYGGDNGIGYKYVYEVTQKGVQRVYFETVLANDAADNVRLEAPFFQMLEKTFSYSQQRKVITLTDLLSYNGSEMGGNYADDDVIYYKLVPQKVNAFVDFTIGIDDNGTPGTIDANDEFLLHSQYLNAYADSQFPVGGASAPQCGFVAVDKADWNTSGRVFGFYPKDGSASQKTIYMYTNRPNSAEVVSISSNPVGSVSVKGSGTYNGNVYGSIVFELANYNPFTFHSKLKGNANRTQQWTYEYGQPVDVTFDITAFTGSDNRRVDPFGTAFKVYIDAPMLEIDEDRRPKGVGTAKFYEEADGRFVYVVDKDEAAERTFFNGDTKVLPFRTAKIVSAGEISLRAEKEVVTYDTETYTITNQLITGKIQYGLAGNLMNVPDHAFVAFERIRDGTRIGRINVSQGQYELLLRGEYSYAWGGDEQIKLRYQAADGTEYTATFDNLAALFARRDVTLLPADN